MQKAYLGRLVDNFTDGLGNLLSALNDILQNAGANNVAEGGLRALNQGLADVADSKCGFVRRDDVVVDDRRERQIDVVLGLRSISKSPDTLFNSATYHADLFGHLNNLNLHVDLVHVS